MTNRQQQAIAGSVPWYVASSQKPRMEQVVLDPGALDFRDEPRMLMLTGLYLRVYQSFWISVLLKLDGAERPAILIKANESTSLLKSQPLKIAFSFIKAATGNMFALFVQFSGPAPFNCPTRPLVFFEDILGLDHEENRDRLRSQLDANGFDVWLAEGGSAKVEGDVMSAKSIDVKYAASLPIEAACREKLKELVEQHFQEHLRIGPRGWNFERSSQNFVHDLPVSVPPILAGPNHANSEVAKRAGAGSHDRRRRPLLHLLRKIFKRGASGTGQKTPTQSTIEGASRERAASASGSKPDSDSTNESPGASVDVDALLAQYQSADQEASTAAFSELMRLADGRDGRLVAPLLGAVFHKEKRVRSLAAALLGTIGDSRAGSALIPLLGDASWDVRYNAVDALGKLEFRDAILPIIQCVCKERNFRVRGRGLHVLEHVFRCVDDRIIGHVQASWRENGIDLEDREGGFD